MDAVFIEGVGVTVASTIVFCGSVFLLLALIMGARLAYFVTASVTLAFLFIMGLIWSFTNPSAPLGPVGVLPEWEVVSVAEEGEPLEGPSAESYPDSGGWEKVDEEDDAQTAQAAELGSSALDAITTASEEGDLPSGVENNAADTDTIRFLQEGDDLYGVVQLNPPEPTTEDAATETAAEEGDVEAPPAVLALMKYDPGNPLGAARLFLVLTTVLLILHLVGLSMSERRARRSREATA